MCAASFRIDPFNADNYCTWKLQMRAILIRDELWKYVDGSTTRPEDAAAFSDWRKMDEKACADITLSISPSELGIISDCTTSKDIWKKLEDTFQSKGPAKRATLLKRVALSSLKEGDCVREHLNAYFNAVKKVKEIGVEIGDELLAILLLYSLPASFETFRVALETRDEIPKPDVLRVKILEEFESRKVKEERGDQNALFAHKIYSPKSNNGNVKNNQLNRKRNLTCFKCGKTGHFARQCKSKWHKNIDNRGNENRDAVLFSTESTSLCGMSDLWCLDSGCTSHMCADKNYFEQLKSENKTLFLANNETAQIKGVGTVKINVDGSNKNINLNEVLYVEGLRTNLLSISKIADNGYDVRFNKNSANIVDMRTNEHLCTADRIGNLYYVRAKNIFNFAYPERKQAIDLWHEKMGHLNENDLKKMVKNKLVHGMNINIKQKLKSCEICLSEKQTRNKFCESKRQTADLLDLVHSDVCGPMKANSFSGARYFVSFIDDKSRYCQLYFIKNKSEVFENFKKFKAAAELQTGRKIKVLQSDNGGEYCSNEFNKFFEECGIKRQFSAPRTPQQNGVAERKNRTLKDMARCMLKQASAPLSFWAEAVNTACYIRNRCPTKSLNHATPYTLWTNKIPVLAHMQIFGTKAYVLNNSTKSKFDARSKACIFVGYASDAKAYRLWDPKNRNIIISRDTKFTSMCGFENNREITQTNMPSARVEISYEQLPETLQETPGTEVEQCRQPLRGRGRPRIYRTGARGRPKKIYQTQHGNDSPNSTASENESGQDIDDEEYESANLATYEDPVTLYDAMNSD